MRYWTYAEIKDKIQKDLGIEQEEWVVASELLNYVNEAIDEAESEIHTIYEDYFLTTTTIDLVQGIDDYSLPSDIYASKIRGIIYKRGQELYALKRMRFNDMFEDIAVTQNFHPSAYYRYLLVNTSAANGVQIKIVPSPRDSITAGLTIWYLRNANRLVDDTDVCDIPEFVHFVIQYAKLKIYEKEGHPNTAIAAQMVEQQRRQMVNTLSSMIPDGDNELEKDLSIYNDMSYDYFGGYY